MKKYTYYSRIRKRRILFKRLRFAGILLCAALLVFGGVKLFGHFRGEASPAFSEQPEVTAEPSPEISPSPSPVPYSPDRLNGIYQQDGKKIAYLTFDDGPSKGVTEGVLDVLKQYGIKATFFTLGSQVQKHPELVKRQKEEGHVVGSHGFSHQYKEIYASNECFTADLDQAEAQLKEILGNDYMKFYRFPGGGYQKSKAPFKEILNAREYYYLDWNCLTDDSMGSYDAEYLKNRLIETAQGKEKLVILMHDAAAKKTTVEALGPIIEYLKGQGYQFATLQDFIEKKIY